LTRVVQVDAGREMRGGQWQALRLASELREMGVEAPLLARDGSPLLAAARARGMEAESLSYASLSRAAHRADLVHAHDSRSHTLAALVCGSRFVVSRRVSFPVSGGWKYRRPIRYLAVSEYVKQVLVDGGIPERKVAVVYDGVPLPDRAAQGTRILVPASDDPRKCLPLALEACRLAGVDPLVSGDLEHAISSAAVLLYLTESEGLGSGALFALASGVPVIASRTGGLPEIIRDGETGLLVENDAACVGGALRRLLSDDALRRKLGESGRAMVAGGFTARHVAERTVRVYKEILGGGA
jgi:hypothetical protein